MCDRFIIGLCVGVSLLAGAQVVSSMIGSPFTAGVLAVIALITAMLAILFRREAGKGWDRKWNT